MDGIGWVFTLAAASAAVVSLYIVLFRNDETYAAYLETARLHGPEVMSASLQAGLLFSWSVIGWGAWLVVLLREHHEVFALVWAVTLVLNACDLVYTGRAIRTRLTDLARAEPFRVHVSPPYRAWRILADGMTVVGCVLALMPGR
ncbi:MAG: hypothetical protein VKQ33_07455 [Candidatus Sericytochromatia bacterium]|nr:hypothetical protein [Candidatus Sericytochromatia bacterium]